MANDPNEQDMSVHDKEHPALGPTWEEQDMSRLDRIVVPPPSHTDPSNPAAASGSVNMAVTTHPSAIAEDYGASVQPGEDDVRSAADVHSLDMQQVHTGGNDDLTFPENRDEWQKKHWVAKTQEYGLASGGNWDTLRERVEEYEGQVGVAKDWNAAEWKDEIDKSDNGADLASLRQLYEASGAQYSTVEEEFQKRSDELNAS